MNDERLRIVQLLANYSHTTFYGLSIFYAFTHCLPFFATSSAPTLYNSDFYVHTTISVLQITVSENSIYKNVLLFSVVLSKRQIHANGKR